MAALPVSAASLAGGLTSGTQCTSRTILNSTYEFENQCPAQEIFLELHYNVTCTLRRSSMTTGAAAAATENTNTVVGLRGAPLRGQVTKLLLSFSHTRNYTFAQPVILVYSLPCIHISHSRRAETASQN